MKGVICTYWKGSFRGREKIYTSDWVYKLKSMVIRNMPSDEVFRFMCMTNVPNEFDSTMEVIPLKDDWKGWWSKIELFRPDLFNDIEKLLYLDLDSLVLKNLTPFFDYGERLTMMQSTKYPSVRYKKGKQIFVKNGSTVMVWKPGIADNIYKKFNYKKCSAEFRGDQDWVTYIHPNIENFPYEWIRKIKDTPNEEPTEEMVIALPMDGKKLGKKNISAAKKYKWVKEIWQ